MNWDDPNLWISAKKNFHVWGPLKCEDKYCFAEQKVDSADIWIKVWACKEKTCKFLFSHGKASVPKRLPICFNLDLGCAIVIGSLRYCDFLFPCHFLPSGLRGHKNKNWKNQKGWKALKNDLF